MTGIVLTETQEAVLLGAIRRTPNDRRDDAWKFAADCLRGVREITDRDVLQTARTIIARYGLDAVASSKEAA